MKYFHNKFVQLTKKTTKNQSVNSSTNFSSKVSDIAKKKSRITPAKESLKLVNSLFSKQG